MQEDDKGNPDMDGQVTTRMTPPLLETNSSSSLAALRKDPSLLATANGNQQKLQTATVWSQLGPLTRLTRPQNFAGIFCFHVLGIYIALQSASRMDLFVNILLAQPGMWLVFSAVILVSCTSVSSVKARSPFTASDLV